MESDHNSRSLPRPVTICCSPDIRLSSERTVTGKRTKLHYCLELSDNLHYSIVGNCMLASVNWTAQLSSASVLLPLPHSSDLAENMPRLRHRMRCRRGSSRRQMSHSPTSSSTSAEASPTSGSTSRANRGRILRSGRSFRSPTPPQSYAHSQTMHFSFNSALNCPRVTTSVMIVFQETPQEMIPNSGWRAESNADAQALRHSAGGLNLQDVEINVDQDGTSQGEAAPPSSEPHEMNIDIGYDQKGQLNEKPDHGNESAQQKNGIQASEVKGPPTTGKVIHSTEDLYTTNGEPDELWCRVVEEAPDE